MFRVLLCLYTGAISDRVEYSKGILDYMSFTYISGRQSGGSATVNITCDFCNWLMSKAKYYKNIFPCTLSVGM